MNTWVNRREFLRGAAATGALLMSAGLAFCRTFGAGVDSSSFQGFHPWLPSGDASGAAGILETHMAIMKGLKSE